MDDAETVSRARWREHVVAALEAMHLLGDDGEPYPLDSLSAVDLALDLEARTGLEFPVEQLRPENFASVDALVATLEALARACSHGGAA